MLDYKHPPWRRRPNLCGHFDMLISRLCVNEIRVMASSTDAPSHIRFAREAFDQICYRDCGMINRLRCLRYFNTNIQYYRGKVNCNKQLINILIQKNMP